MNADVSNGDSDPRPSAREVRSLVMAELSLPARIGHVALLLAGLASAAVSGSLVIGERGLPTRTTAALILITAVGLSWSVFAAWTLTRRRTLLATHRLIASRMAVAFSALFTAGAAAVGWSTRMEASWLAVGTGLVMLGVASALLVRARRRVAELRSRRTELEHRLMAVLVVFLAAAPIPASAQQPGSPNHHVEAGTFQVGDAAVAVELGSFTVLANRSRAGSGTLTLRYMRFPSTAAVAGPPIVFLAGGPGDAATRAFQGMPVAFLDSLRATGDVIAFDQRGTGTSEPQAVACEGGTMLPRAEIVPPAARLSALAVQLRACLERASASGVDVAGLTTAGSADDLEALRLGLGAPRLSLLAGSYGTHLALAAVRRHPASIARVALLGVDGPDHTLKSPLRIDDVLARIGAARRPSLADNIRTLRHRLAEAPARFTFPTGQTLVMGEWDLQRWVADALDTEREIATLLAALPAVLAGEYAELARSALPYRLPRTINLMNVGSTAPPSRVLNASHRSARKRPSHSSGTSWTFRCRSFARCPDSFRSPPTSAARSNPRFRR